MSPLTSADRLYRLLPRIYRQRDREVGEPLRALMAVLQEQADLIERDIDQLYDNWFIETCEAWAVPHLGRLLGLESARAPFGGTDDDDEDASSWPRRAVADAIRHRRRKGTLSLLHELSQTLTDWPTRIVELDRRLVATQSIRHGHGSGGGTASLRYAHAPRVGPGCDDTTRILEVRRLQSHRTRGRYPPRAIAVQVWPLLSIPVTRMPAFSLGPDDDRRYTFDATGHDTPLFVRARNADAPSGGPDQHGRLTRALLTDAGGHVSKRFYGHARSLSLWHRSGDAESMVAAERIVVADLGSWRFRAAHDMFAIDPERGRIVLGRDVIVGAQLLVSYCRGASAWMGGGEYLLPAALLHAPAGTYYVGPDMPWKTLGDALRAWQDGGYRDAVIEWCANEIATDIPHILVASTRHLEIRAAAGVQPLIDLRQPGTGRGRLFATGGGKGSCLTLTGLAVVGGTLDVSGDLEALTVRHCTFVPTWPGGASPSVSVKGNIGTLAVTHSLVGALVLRPRRNTNEPILLKIADSIVDGRMIEQAAIGSSDGDPSGAALIAVRSTFLGSVCVERLQADDCLFHGQVTVRDRQCGHVRSSFVPAGSDTPPRLACQPDASLLAASGDGEHAAIRLRVQPRFASLDIGMPGYGLLSRACCSEIALGARDGGEMGALNARQEARQRAMLLRQIADHLPADTDIGLIDAP